jgi:hypothetical protein
MPIIMAKNPFWGVPRRADLEKRGFCSGARALKNTRFCPKRGEGKLISL